MERLFKTLIVLLLCCSKAVAQEGVVLSSDTTRKVVKPVVAFSYLKPKGPKAIVHEMSGGFRLNTDGWSVCMDRGHVKTPDLKHADMFHNLLFWELEFSEKNNPKEEKVTSAMPNPMGGSRTYKYGKINNFYALKLGLGYQKMLAGKPDPGCVSIHWVTTGGFALGLLKPYYINVYGDPQAIKFTDQTQSDFLPNIKNQASLIEGSAGFSKGLDEMVYVPGGFLKTGLHFDFSANKKTIISVETGASIEYYSQAIQIMANQPATAGFYNLFIALQVGKRW